MNLIIVPWWGLFEFKPQKPSTKDYKIWEGVGHGINNRELV